MNEVGLLDKMVDFELDAVKSGVVLMTECHRDPEDETKWKSKKMHALFRLWQAGARYGANRKVVNETESTPAASTL